MMTREQYDAEAQRIGLPPQSEDDYRNYVACADLLGGDATIIVDDEAVYVSAEKQTIAVQK